MKSLLVTSEKGGVGCSTVASSIAVASAKDGTKTLLVDVAPGSLTALLGLPDNDGALTEVTENLWLVGSQYMGNPSEYGLVVVDAGTSDFVLDGAERVGVVRNCYLSLKKAVNGRPCDYFICVEETERALSARDAEMVLHKPVVRVAYDTAVNRAVDAGLIVNRMPAIAPWTQEIVRKAKV